jgi:glycosyltransferase involved in cell wall biosynthesis
MKKPCKIIHLIESLGRGGAEQSLLTLLPLLQDEGVAAEVVVLDGTSPDKRALCTDFMQAGIEVNFLAAGSLIAKARQLQAILQLQPVAALQAHLTRSVMVAGWAVRSLAEPPVLIGSLHNQGYEKPVPWHSLPKHVLKKYLARQAATSFAHWQAVSDAVKKHYHWHWRLPENRIEVIPNCIRVDAPEISGSTDLPSAGGVIEEPCLVVLPGRLVPEKNHAFALHLARGLAAAGKNIRWVFAGGGPLQLSLQEQISRLGLEDSVQITGELEQKTLHDWLAQATVVIQPSLQEGFGMTAAEAMALGRPVLVSDVGGLPALAADAARVLPVNNLAAWQAALTYLLDSPVARSALGEAGRKRIAGVFVPDKIKDHWLQFYRQAGILPDAKTRPRP